MFVFVILAHRRRTVVHIGVTAHPTAEWSAQQMREAFPWDDAPRYLLRDRDRIFGKEFVDQVERATAMTTCHFCGSMARSRRTIKINVLIR